MNADGAQINADARRQRLNAVSRAIIGAAQNVSNQLGLGFLEKVYENSLVIMLEQLGLHVVQQGAIQVYFQGHIVGDYIPDLLVEDSVIVEIKALQAIDRVHRQQCVNYLRATNHTLALLLNFGRPHLEVARIVWHF